MTAACIICAAPIRPRKGVEQHYCSAACRKTFHDGCRRIGQRLYREGKVSIEQIKSESN